MRDLPPDAAAAVDDPPEPDAIIGASDGLATVMQRVELVGPSDVPVLVLGETGSGKEVIARCLHARSQRRAGPFVRVNCGAIPPELVDSQLFGHERGSFTGATDRRQGWFERADGGTLFLDEIGELPPAAQVRLLRVLQDGTIERVGGQSSVRVDCRIIAATHRDLPAMVEAGTFREDLWYRLSVFPLVVPPLRERPKDIPALARYFASRAIRFGLPPCELTEDDLTALLEYAWPGNVRELAAVIDRAAILGRGERLELRTALGVSRPARSLSTAVRLGLSTASAARTILPLEDVIREHIELALSVSGGRIEGPSGAAALLEVNPHTLRSRMRKLGIDWTLHRRSHSLRALG